MSSGRYVIEGSAGHWCLTDLASPEKPVSIHRQRDDADRELARLEARQQRTAAPRQTALFDPRETP